MKKCPSCDRTFEDSMKFCQADGTPLVDDAPEFDPYATIVGSAGGFVSPRASDADQTVSAGEDSGAVAEETEVDPLKTMYASDTEMKAILQGGGESNKDIGSELLDIPPIGGTGPSQDTAPEPQPPSYRVPEVPAPSFGDISPPPSPFTSSGDRGMSTPTAFEEPQQPRFDEAATIMQPDPFAANTQASQWTPPPAPDPGWQPQDIGSNTPFNPPPASLDGQNKTLAIISLVLGILSLICCSWFVPGIAAIVLGFIARSKAKSDPATYGGEGLALAGIITGGISVVLGVIVIILYVAGALAGSIGNF